MKKKILLLGVLVAGLVTGGLWWLNLPRGVVSYNLPEEALGVVKGAVSDEEVRSDVLISEEAVSEVFGDELIFEVEVPVVDFYYRGEIKYVPFEDLDGSVRVTSQDGENYLESFKRGARFHVIKIASENEEERRRFEEKIRAVLPTFPTSLAEVLTINQTGVTALARGMQAKLNEVGDGAYFAEKIKDFLAATDLTHISNEVSFVEGCQTERGSTVLCADERMFETIKAIGTDVVELTGNHNVDFGAEAALRTLNLYHEEGISTFGGGAEAEEATLPLEIEEKGNRITWLGYNLSTTKAGAGGATAELPGANIYDEERAKQQIAEAKARGDFVIVDVQFYECYCYPDGFLEYEVCDEPIGAEGLGQEEFFKHLIDLGADMVVGTQAHQPQVFEIYNGKPIYYGLGNLFFDQVYWPGTERSLVLTHYFYEGRLLQTVVTPTVYDEDLQTRKMEAEEAREFIERLARGL